MGLELAFAHRRYSRDGGVERNVVALTEGMAARGHRVAVLCERVDAEPPPGVRVVRIRTRGPSALRLFAFDRGVRQAVERGSFDVVQGFDLTTRQDVLRVGRGLVRVYRQRLDRDRGALDRLAKRLSAKQAAMRWLEAEMFRPGAFRRLVANSRVLAGEIVATYGVDPALIEVIHNGVDTQRFRPSPPDRALRAELDLATGAPLVLFVGTGFHRKGLATVLRAFARVHDELPRAHLAVVGRDGRMDRYRRLADELHVGDAVTWAGARGDVERFYACADVLALPTRYDPFPNVTLEAMACGVPAVVSAAAGSSEVMEGALAELVLPDAEDAEGLARRLVTVLRDAAGERALPVLARATAERHDVESMLDAYEALYERLACAPATAGTS